MNKLIELGWQLGALFLILLVGFLCFQLIRKSLERLRERNLITQPLFLIATNTLRWILIITVVIASLQQMGIKIANILTVLLTVAGMIAIGFIAVWSVLSNILCSLMLIIFRNFNMGDEIEIVEPVGGPGLKGKVVGFNVMFTTLAEQGDQVEPGMVTQVPNNIFFQKNLRRKKGIETESLGQYLLTKPTKMCHSNEGESD